MAETVQQMSEGGRLSAVPGHLVSQMNEQTSHLIRDELALASAQMTEKGKKAGLGAALFGGSGLITMFGVACLVAAAILALSGSVAAWAAALIVGGVLLAAAVVAALVGKRKVAGATPPVPIEAVARLQQDIRTLKPGGRS